MKKLTFLILLLIAVFTTYDNYQIYNKNQSYLDGQFSSVKNIKLETVIQVKSEVGESGFKKIFLAKDIYKNFEDMNYKISAPMRDINFGDCLKVTGSISRPENMKDKNETIYNFPYREYLAKDNVYLLYNVTRLEYSNLCPSLSSYEEVKLFFLNEKIKITKIFLSKYEQPYAGLVAGVLIAGKGLMNKETIEIFKRVSLSHVVVLSGSNVSMIVFFIKFLFDLFFKIVRIKENKITDSVKKIFMIIFITSFTLLTGGGAPIYRAFISTTCALLFFKKNISQLYALTIVVLIMTIINPFGSLYDPSFHLTCCATYGLIMFSKYFDHIMIFSWMNFLPNFLREIISVTLATQVFVFPYIIFMSGSFSSVFLLSNVLILPLIPIIMLLGFLSLFPLVSGVVISLNNVILKIVFAIVHVLSEVPGGYVVFGKEVNIWILIVYGFFVLWLLGRVRSFEK